MFEEIREVVKKNPGLTGREIAKKTGKDRKAVNAFLHQNKNVFAQDENFHWSLVETDELRIVLPKKTWVDADVFEDTLLKYDSPVDATECRVVFVISEKCRVLLEPACRMLALCNQLSDVGKSVTIDFTASISALNYLDRAGFFESLNSNCAVLPKRPKSSRAKKYKGNSDNLVEFGLIDSVSGEEDLNKRDKNLVNQLTETFVKLVDKDYEEVASVIFAELIGNIKRHSQSELQGIAGLQRYTGRRQHIQTIVSDSGVGIATTLKTGLETHYPDLYRKREQDDYDLFIVEEALTKGEISRFGKGNGLGFGITTQKAKKFNASLSVRQETFSIKFFYNDNRLVTTAHRRDLAKIRGTHLCFDFNID